MTVVLGNEFVLARLVSTDGEIAATSVWIIRLFDVTAVVAALVCLRYRNEFDAALRTFVSTRPGIAAAIFGLGTAFAAVGLFEATFWTLNQRRHEVRDVSAIQPEFRPGETATATLVIDGETIFDVRYTIDNGYRRVSPHSDDTNPEREILFFGGSFVFGHGVADDETLPDYVAQQWPNTRVVNYGFPGHGPQHMLERIDDVEAEVDFKAAETVAVYVFIPDHVRRAVGSMRIAAGWGRNFPDYRIDPNGVVSKAGVFSDRRGLLPMTHRLLRYEQFLAYRGVDLPLLVGSTHFEFTATLVEESRRRLNALKSTRFLVLLYPPHPTFEFPTIRLAPHLDTRGIEYCELASAIDATKPDMLIPHDLHPSAEANRKIAEAVMAYLSDSE